ncbi:related to ubiquitin carboxyl-terminal hydrolase isozyme L3 [Cephalotrichum gorgonifer]|uniref:Ubiquitin carboxyl-terminal hydrolase n=1 Tax=Cephalotrichum gorgonifer TaxID=2041049 RepID=A0AAE8MZB7_9PEZI|nr:related to ubiquitin carboxyl-terminal hydrolase isozyme L3 [Cephalotrichum gorgonifer]
MAKSEERRYEKHFIPLESDPEIFNQLIYHLGAPRSLAFRDVLSLDEPDLMPHPAIALILILPTTESYEATKAIEYAAQEEYQGKGEDEDVMWFKQTIQNACGLYGILHALCNGEARSRIKPGTPLARIVETCTPLAPHERSLELENSDEVEEAYNKVALLGSTQPPEDPEDEIYYHYLCFVRSHVNGRLYELDGDCKGPIDRGSAPAAGDDMLGVSGLDIIRACLNRDRGNPNFSLMALVLQ